MFPRLQIHALLSLNSGKLKDKCGDYRTEHERSVFDVLIDLPEYQAVLLLPAKGNGKIISLMCFSKEGG